MHRFFSELSNKNNIALPAEDINHAVNVLRLKIGEEIVVCDGDCNDFLCRIDSISKKNVELEFLSHTINQNEPKTKVTLFQGLPKSDKMELIIQKCVELGVQSIVPVETKRSIAKIKDNGEKKQARWQSIALSAAKQSHRGIVPQIGTVISFEEALKQISAFDLSLIPYELENSKSMNTALKESEEKTSNIAIFIGPEGGFDEHEIALAKTFKIIPVSLGRRILRTETAGLAALIMAHFALGEYDE